MKSEQRFLCSRLQPMTCHRVVALYLSVIGLLIGPACMAAESASASFPNHAVRIIVGFAPGGTADIVARLMAKSLSELWKQPVVVDNRPGASGVIGADLVAKAPKDGYTIGTVSATFAILPALGEKLPYDVQKDFTILNRVVEIPYLLVAGNGSNVANVKTVAELLNVARSKPAGISHASSGPGSTEQLAAALLGSAAKVSFLDVPYKGTGAAIPDLIAGRVDIAFSAIPDLIGPVRNKTLRALAVGSKKRLSYLPDVPSVSETLKDFEMVQWFALAAPAGLPRAVAEKLNADLGSVATSAALKSAWDERLVAGTSFSLKESDDFYRAQLVRWDRIVKSLGLNKQPK
jgi:tripartite-type tricarboxylate transporter receptor subunit TctC